MEREGGAEPKGHPVRARPRPSAPVRDERTMEIQRLDVDVGADLDTDVAVEGGHSKNCGSGRGGGVKFTPPNCSG